VVVGGCRERSADPVGRAERRAQVEIWGFVILAVGALAIGAIARYVGTPRLGYEWVLGAVAAFAGGFVASEYLGLSGWGPEAYGLLVVPALLGAAVLAAAVVVLARATAAPTAS
jgi:hypothetical protein